MATIVRVEQLSKSYGATQAPVLKDVSLSIEEGEFVAIMGPSGSGKSTLLHLIGGLDRATTGTIFIGDRCINHLTDKELSRQRRKHIGFVFQFYNLIPVLSARENVAMPLILDSIKRADALQRADDAIKTVGLSERADHHPSELSGGEQQRIAIARALVSNPALILADEPTGALDTRSGDEIVALLRYSAETLQRTVVIVTHDPRVAASAHRIIYLRDGEITDDNRMSREKYASTEMAERVRAKVLS